MKNIVSIGENGASIALLIILLRYRHPQQGIADQSTLGGCNRTPKLVYLGLNDITCIDSIHGEVKAISNYHQIS